MNTKIKIDFDISEALAREVLTTAYEAGHYGIGYWAHIRSASYIKTQGASRTHVSRLVIDPVDTDDTTFTRRCTVTTQAVREGVRNILSAKLVNTENTGRVLTWLHDPDAGDMDGNLSDLIIQAGMFGEITYG